VTSNNQGPVAADVSTASPAAHRRAVSVPDTRLLRDLRYDGAWHWSLVLAFGLEGGEIVPHGDACRWDWGLTMGTLFRSQAYRQ
jgi:hypothetical protein